MWHKSTQNLEGLLFTKRQTNYTLQNKLATEDKKLWNTLSAYFLHNKLKVNTLRLLKVL